MATVARTKQDVDEMTRQERLWDSLNHAYGKQREATNKEYDKAISQADRQMLGRGMQRSSFNSQVLGNLSNQKINAQDESWNNQIAKYEEGLMTLDQQDAENERWEKQFNEGVRQFNENLAWQSGEREKERAYNTSEREAQQLYNTGEREAQQAWQAGQNELARAFQTSEREAQQKYNTSEREAQQGWQSGENERNRAYNTAEREAQQKYNTAEREAQQAFQSGENALTRAENARQFNENMGYNREQAQIAADQWERQFAQGNADTAQKLAASYVAAIAEQGGVPSDELLARAGLSRADAEAMRKAAKGSSSGGTPKTTVGDGDGNPPGTPNGDTPYDEAKPTTASSIFKNTANTINWAAYLSGAGGKPTSTDQGSSSSPVVGNDNGYANRYWDTAPVTGTTINPIEQAFTPSSDEIYYEVDLDKENGLTKSKNQNNGGKIKSTTVKKNN